MALPHWNGQWQLSIFQMKWDHLLLQRQFANSHIIFKKLTRFRGDPSRITMNGVNCKYRRKGYCRQRNTNYTPTSHAKDTHTHTITHTASIIHILVKNTRDIHIYKYVFYQGQCQLNVPIT